MKRSQIAEKYKWDLSGYCKDDSEFFERLKKLEEKKDIFKKYENHLSNEKLLLEMLNLDSEISQELEILACYAYRKRDENLADKIGQQMKDAFTSVNTKFAVATSFITPELSQFDDKKLEKLQKNPLFANYDLLFHEIIREKKHILKKNEEQIISGMGEFLGGFSSVFNSFSDADLKFDDIVDGKGKKHKLDQANLSLYTSSADRVLRENAMKGINKTFGRFSNMLSQNYLASVKEDCYFSKLRQYSSALARELYADEIDEKVYDNLIASVRKNIKFLYRFFEAKRKKLKLERFALFDQFAPVGKSLSKKYTFEEAFELFKKSTKVLGENYTKILEKAFDERWIDVFPNDGKRSGAYSSGAYKKNPIVLMNFVGDFRSVETLAHEMGHSVHTYFSEHNQCYEKSDYTIFVAEVASTVNEILLNFYILKNLKSNEQKGWLIDNFMTNVKSTIFRQTMFAEFEEWVHDKIEKGDALSKDSLCDKYLELNKFYFGNKVKIFNEIKYEWMRIPHFYSAYYVYKYATGLVSALNIVRRILNGEKDAVKKYLKFLGAGCTKPPVELLKDAGCDLEDPKTFDDVFEFLQQLLTEYEKI